MKLALLIYVRRRLARMDLGGNELIEVLNLHQLSALETCDLSKLVPVAILMRSVH